MSLRRSDYQKTVQLLFCPFFSLSLGSQTLGEASCHVVPRGRERPMWQESKTLQLATM